MLEINNTTRRKIDRQKIEKIGQVVLQKYQKKNYLISLALIGAGRMRGLNRDYRGLNKTTDVLAFPAAVSVLKINSIKNNYPAKYLGEVIINISETDKVSKYRAMFKEIGRNDFTSLKLNQTKKRAAKSYLFYFLLIHGLLHLLGYDDQTAAGHREMMSIGEKILAKIK